MENNKIKTIIRSIIHEYKNIRINELALDSDIVSDFLDLVIENPFVIEELGFKNMKHLKSYVEDNGYSEFRDIRDEVNDLIKNKKK